MYASSTDNFDRVPDQSQRLNSPQAVKSSRWSRWWQTQRQEEEDWFTCAERDQRKEGGEHKEDCRWLASWITSAGQSGNASTGGRGGTPWRLLSLEFWSVALEREWLNDWKRCYSVSFLECVKCLWDCIKNTLIIPPSLDLFWICFVVCEQLGFQSQRHPCNTTCFSHASCRCDHKKPLRRRHL